MGRSPEKKTMAVPNKPITPKVVHDLLREKVLKGFVVAPKANDPLVKYLAQISEDIRSEARAHHGLGKEQQKRVATIREALYVLETELPKYRTDYLAAEKKESGPRKSRGWTEKQLHRHINSALVKFDALIAAVDAFRAAYFPSNSTLFSETMYASEWKYFAEALKQIFLSAIPEARKEGTYRFITAIAPLITGETPSEKAVRSHFMHRRSTLIYYPPTPERLAPTISPPKTDGSERTRRPR